MFIHFSKSCKITCFCFIFECVLRATNWIESNNKIDNLIRFKIGLSRIQFVLRSSCSRVESNKIRMKNYHIRLNINFKFIKFYNNFCNNRSLNQCCWFNIIISNKICMKILLIVVTTQALLSKKPWQYHVMKVAKVELLTRIYHCYQINKGRWVNRKSTRATRAIR